MSNHERIDEIEYILDNIEERIDKISNRVAANIEERMVQEGALVRLLMERAELEREKNQLERTSR